MKQETLEEAIKSYCEKEYSTLKPLGICIDFAKLGANWQAERMYSEEEVDELVNNLIDKFLNYNGSSVDNEKLKWFYQQFKKK